MIRPMLKAWSPCGMPQPQIRSSTDEGSTRRYMEWGTTFTAVGLDAMVLARETEKLAAKFKF